jgi:transposase-like protein
VLERRHLWECSACALQTSVTAGTVMQRTRTPLQTWFWAAYRSGSRFETAWLVLQKLRRAMVAPQRELLMGEVEIDDFWLGGYEAGLKGSRQRGKKALVGAAIEVRGHGSGRLRLQVLANSQAKTLAALTTATTATGAIVHTDALNSYAGLGKLGYEHRPRKQTGASADEQLLARVHRAISNLKAWMHGTHRGVSHEHLPVYLDEFVFRHNRRGTPMAAFQTLLGPGSLHDPTTYDEITALGMQPESTGYASTL